MFIKRNLLAVLAALLAFWASPAWSQAKVKTGCEPIAEAYMRQAIRLSAEANKVSDWNEKSDYKALCSFYSVEYPTAQIAYLDKIKELKKKDTCWTKDDDKSMQKNYISFIQSARLWNENCKKAGIVPGNERKTQRFECVIKSELVDALNRDMAKGDADRAKKGIVMDAEWHKNMLDELYLYAEMNRLIVAKAEDCTGGRTLWHPPQKLK